MQTPAAITIHAFVQVTGFATDNDDAALPGWYAHEVTLPHGLDPAALPAQVKAEIARSVLDDFHEHQGISVLDDFTIEVFLASGETVQEDDTGEPFEGNVRSSHMGKMDEAELPDLVEQAAGRAQDRPRAA